MSQTRWHRTYQLTVRQTKYEMFLDQIFFHELSAIRSRTFSKALLREILVFNFISDMTNACSSTHNALHNHKKNRHDKSLIYD